MAFLPLLSSGAGTAPDGQFGQFFEGFELWSDRYAGGWPAYADPTNMALYPFKYLFPATREGLDWFLLWALVTFAAGNGMLAWALTRSRAGTALGIAASPLLGFTVAHLNHLSMIHAAAYLPWMAYGAWSLMQGGRARAMVLMAVPTGLSLLAGHPQITAYGLLGSALFVVPVSGPWRDSAAGVARLGGSVALAVGLAAAFLLPAHALSGETLRASLSPVTLAEFSLHPGEVALNVWPFQAGGFWVGGGEAPYVLGGPAASWVEDLGYVGTALTMLAVIALALARPREPAVRCAVVVFAALSLAVAPAFPSVADLLVHVPVVSKFRAWGRWQVVGSVFALQLACIGLTAVLRRPDRNGCAFGALAALAVVVVAFALTRRFDVAPGAGRYAAFQWAAAAGVCTLVVASPYAHSRRLRWVLTLALVAIPCAELWYLSRGAAWLNAPGRPLSEAAVEQLSELKAAVDAHPGRTLSLSGWQSPHRGPDAVRAAGLASLNWYGPLLNERFATLSGLTTGGWVRPEVLAPGNQVLDIYGVSIVEGYSDAVDPAGKTGASTSLQGPRWEQVSPGTPALYHNRRALPRVRLVAESLYLTDDAGLAALTRSLLPDGTRFDAAKQVIVPDPALAGPAAEQVPAMRVGIDEATITVSLASPTMAATTLVVGDNYSRNWHARIDGEPARVARVNFNQVGIRLPPGSRQVELYYRDGRLLLGAAISVLSLVVVALLLMRRTGVPSDA